MALRETLAIKTLLEIQATLVVITMLTSSTRSTGSSELKEYCQSEYFNVTCPRNEVVLMETAHYGRMHAGRCVTNSLGCYKDVLGYFDGQCSGRRHCSVYIADANLHKMAICSKDLTSYLEARYTCIEAATGSVSTCRRDQHVTLSGQTSGHLASVTSLEHGIGSGTCPWRVLAGSGQTIRLTLLSFGGGKAESNARPSSVEPCYDIGEVREVEGDVTGVKQTLSLCTGSGRERVVYTSRGNDVTVQLLPKDVLHGMAAFMIRYEVQGCQTMKAPAGGWLRIDGNTATVRCNGSKETFYMTCTDNQWIGHAGNCTDKSSNARSASAAPFSEDGFPYGILVVVAIGVALGVLIGGILLSFVAYYMKRQSHLRRYSEPAELTKQIMDEMDSSYGGTGGPRSPAGPHPLLFKGPPPGTDPRYIQDLAYSRTVLAYADPPEEASPVPQRCTCPKGAGLHLATACHHHLTTIPPGTPAHDGYTTTANSIHTYDSPEYT